MKQLTILVVVLSPAVALNSGCDNNQQIPLAEVKTPPPLPAQDKSKIKAPKGHSPDVLPEY